MTISESTAKGKWLEEVFDSVDNKDTARFIAYLRKDAEFCFGSAPAVKGHEQIFAAVEGFFSSIAGCSHRLDNTWFGNGTVACEGAVTYQRRDGSEITLPFADVFDMDGDLISRYKIYIDIGPLYAE